MPLKSDRTSVVLIFRLLAGPLPLEGESADEKNDVAIRACLVRSCCGDSLAQAEAYATERRAKKNAKRSAWRITRLTKTFYAKGQLLVK